MAKPRRRQSDHSIIFKVWDKVAPGWHMLTTAFLVFCGIVLWVGQVSSHEARITKLEGDKERFAAVEQRVNDIADFMGVPHRGN